MVDVVDRAIRSRMMSGIRGKHTQPELRLRRALHRRGLRFRLHDRKLPGRPDIVFPKYKAAIQVHGCFWHRHQGCGFSTTPASNIVFWKGKFRDTVKRDQRNLGQLLSAGWRVAVVWECELGGDDDVKRIGDRLAKWLESRKRFVEIPRMKPRARSKKPRTRS